MKALLIGATGATGKDLLNTLLQDAGYTEVTIFVRRESGVVNPKLKEILTDFDQLEKVAGSISGDVLFSCLGTTLNAAGSKENQLHVDYEIPLQFATIARKNGVARMVLLSAYGADAASMLFYSRVKGKLEEAVATLGFELYVIFRPGLLLRKNTDRMGERIGAGVLGFMNKLGLMRRLRPLPTETLAGKMAKAPRFFSVGKHVVAADGIFGF